MACLKSVMNGRDLSAGSFQCTKDQALCSWLESSGDERPGLESLFPQCGAIVPSLLCAEGQREGPEACADRAQMRKFPVSFHSCTRFMEGDTQNLEDPQS